MSCVVKRVDTEDMLGNDLQYLIDYSKRERRLMHETSEGYAPMFHHVGVGNISSRDLIRRCRGVISLHHWEFLTRDNGSQYATGYLPNGRRWFSSSIRKVRFGYNEHISHHLEVTTRNTKYLLPAESSVFSIQWLNFDGRFTREQSLHCDMGNVINIENWEVVDKNWRGGVYHTYYLNARVPTPEPDFITSGFGVKSNKITNILFYNGELQDEPLIYFVTSGGFMYRARYDTSLFHGEYLEL